MKDMQVNMSLLLLTVNDNRVYPGCKQVKRKGNQTRG